MARTGRTNRSASHGAPRRSSTASPVRPPRRRPALAAGRLGYFAIRRHARHRHLRLERLGQDHPDHQGDPAPAGARADGLDHQARPPRLRRRPAGQGFAHPPHRRGDRGADRLGQPLGADARAARRGGAVALRPAAEALAGRPRRGRGLQARAAPQDRGVPRRRSASRRSIPTTRHRRRSLRTTPLPQRQRPVVDIDDIDAHRRPADRRASRSTTSGARRSRARERRSRA